LKEGRERSARLALAAAFATGLGQQVFRHRLMVSVDERLAASEYEKWLVLPHLAAELGEPDLFAGIVVGRRPGGKVKPTLQLFAPSGRPAGFAKLGWSPRTKGSVRTESAVLASLGGRLGHLLVPSLLATGDWDELVYSVTSPLPPSVRRWTKAPDTAPQATLDVARSVPLTHAPLAGSQYARRLRADITEVAGHEARVAGVLGEWLDRLEPDPTVITFGRWHGDWVPWNLGRTDTRLVAWDWEYSATGVPVGYDVLHWHYQRSLFSGTLAEAVLEVDRAAQGLGSQGVALHARPLVASLYLLEIFLRTAKNSVGRNWNPRIYPHLFELVSSRDRA
jgi:hypothetical protein